MRQMQKSVPTTSVFSHFVRMKPAAIAPCVLLMLMLLIEKKIVDKSFACLSFAPVLCFLSSRTYPLSTQSSISVDP